MTAWFFDAQGKFVQTLDLPDDFVRSGVNARLPRREPMRVSYRPSEDDFAVPDDRVFRQTRCGDSTATYEEIT